MKKNTIPSEEALVHALLAEDARLQNGASDTALLDAIDAQISHFPKGRKHRIRKPWLYSSIAACLLLFLVCIGMMKTGFQTYHSVDHETIISYQAPPEDSEAVVRERTKSPSAPAPAPPAAASPIANIITTNGTHSVTIPDNVELAEVESIAFGSRDDFGMQMSDAIPEPKAELPRLRQSAERIKLRMPVAEATTSRYAPIKDQVFQSPLVRPLSTFSVDTDRASYTQVRNQITQGRKVHPDSVRIEELINAFDYQYAPPSADSAHPFSTHVETNDCPWNPDHRLMMIGLKGREVTERPATNLVLLCDVSGSMQSSNKLGYLKPSLMELIENLDERDSVAIVTYAGSEGVALPPTRVTSENSRQIFQAIETLRAGGSTNGEAGIKLAYRLAEKHFVKGGVNRVILATDGDFNVGVTSDEALLKRVKAGAKKGTYLTVLGFGHDNLNDQMLEKITNEGNGQYFFVDSQREGHRIFSKELTGTLVTIAKDTKIQIEFNPDKVAQYRLIGYANRQLKDEDFNNDRVDAGELGSGHSVTALYEITPGPARDAVDPLKYQSSEATAKRQEPSPELCTVKLRYKLPEQSKSALIEVPVTDSGDSLEQASSRFRTASSVALFGMLLRDTYELSQTHQDVIDLARPALEDNIELQEFLELVAKVK